MDFIVYLLLREDKTVEINEIFHGLSLIKLFLWVFNAHYHC